MNRLKGGEKKGERRFDRREGLKRLLTTILSAIPEAGVVGEWRGDGVALQQWFVAVSCRFATCMAISAPCPSIPSSHLVLAPRLLDNELSNYRHAFSSPFSLSLSSPFSSNTSFSQTSKLRKESNFFLLFFFFPRDEREKYYIGSQNEVSTAGWEYVGLRFAGHLAVDEQSSGDRGPGRK